MRVWADLTNTAHVFVLRPLVDLLERDGHEVELTARPLSQTVEMLENWGHPYTVLGNYGGATRLGKARAAAARLPRLLRFAHRRHFDCALAHGSTDLPAACRVLGVPATTMLDYEWAVLQRHVDCRLASRVLMPDAIPAERVVRYGARPPKLVRYPGLKEDYYLSDFEPDEAVLDQLGVDRDRVLVVLRPPPDVSLYHRRANVLYPRMLEHLGGRESVQAVVLPRTPAQRAELGTTSLPSLIVPDGPIDAQSLIAYADLVVSAGGTMNREAVALGVPVYTTYAARLGAVDERLMREDRLRPLSDPEAIELVKRDGPAPPRTRRDPGVLVEKMLAAAAV